MALTRSCTVRIAATPSPYKRPASRSPLGDLTNDPCGQGKRRSPARECGSASSSERRSSPTPQSPYVSRIEDTPPIPCSPANHQHAGGWEEPQVAVQRFSLVSRTAQPRSARASRQSQSASFESLTLPANLANFLGPRLSICRCSDCLGRLPLGSMVCETSGNAADIDSAEQPRICRVPTEAHPEYELLLAMSCRFLAACPWHNNAALGVVTSACKREQSAYLILAPGSASPTIVGYVAAICSSDRMRRRKLRSASAAPTASSEHSESLQLGSIGCDGSGSRRAQVTVRQNQSHVCDAASAAPILLQVWVEAEYRRQGYASGALRLLLRGHNDLLVHDPTPVMISLLRAVGFETSECRRASRDSEGRYLNSFTRVGEQATDDV